MKHLQTIFFTIFILIFISPMMHGQALGTVTDFDGNIYTEIQIGNQIWLKENIKSLHYSDGTAIPAVAVYNNLETMADVYGRLYTWQAAMRNSTEEGAQGVAPDGYHVASDAEWTELENFLGGANVAGGKMKEAGTERWKAPNTGADNSSGFSALPAGEYDAHYTPNVYRLLSEYAVFWTSTQINSQLARERFLAFDKASCQIYDWYKVMKYSIRCIKNSQTTGIGQKPGTVPSEYQLAQNYPNPFNPSTIITFKIPEDAHVNLAVFDTLGRKVETLISGEKPAGTYNVNFNADHLSSGIYIYRIETPSYMETKKMLLIR